MVKIVLTWKMVSYPADSDSEDKIVNNLVEEIHQQSNHYSARDGEIWSKEPIAQHATGRLQVHNLVREQQGPTREVSWICANSPADSFKMFLTPEIVNIIVVCKAVQLFLYRAGVKYTPLSFKG